MLTSTLIEYKDKASLAYFLTAIQYLRIKQDLSRVKQFSSDGCTGVPDLIFKSCCKSHDYDYSLWGKLSRWAADLKFFRCMKKRIQEEEWTDWWERSLPYVYWLGVRVLGRSHFKRVKHNG